MRACGLPARLHSTAEAIQQTWPGGNAGLGASAGAATRHRGHAGACAGSHWPARSEQQRAHGSCRSASRSSQQLALPFQADGPRLRRVPQTCVRSRYCAGQMACSLARRPSLLHPARLLLAGWRPGEPRLPLPSHPRPITALPVVLGGRFAAWAAFSNAELCHARCVAMARTHRVVSRRVASPPRSLLRSSWSVARPVCKYGGGVGLIARRSLALGVFRHELFILAQLSPGSCV